MRVMENSDLQISAEYDGSVAVESERLSDENNVTEIEDDRIPCTNNGSLNKILQIAIGKATNVAESLKVEDSKSKFVNRFTEVFCDIVHENVCVDGLPWAVSVNALTSREREQQELETDHARLSKLMKEVERVARKRKTTARECTRIREIRLKHQRQNLRKLKLECSAFISSTPIPTLQKDFPHQELAQICKDLSLAKTKIQKITDDLPTLQKNFEMAQDIRKRQKVHLDDDTGYISC